MSLGYIPFYTNMNTAMRPGCIGLKVYAQQGHVCACDSSLGLVTKLLHFIPGIATRWKMVYTENITVNNIQ